MVLIRPAAFRAPLARFARPAARSSPLQAFQRTARRGYASAGGAAKKESSDLPWLATGIVITVPSVYYILSSIESGGHHDESHGEHGEEHHEEKEEELEAKDEPEAKEESKSEEKGEETNTTEAKNKEKNEASDATEEEPSPRGEAKPNEISGKQEGISNADTHHSTNISDDPNRSSKGEGVEETAKLKGTVQSDRPGAESAQKGQAKQDKSK